MRIILKSFAAVVVAALVFTSCKKDVKDADPNEISDQTLAAIQNAGFGTNGIKKIPEGYLVEGDIVLTDAEIKSGSSSPNMIIAQEEQYRTFNWLSATRHPVVYVALNNSSAAHEAAFSAALDEAIRRYNAEALTFTMKRVAYGAGQDITVVAFYENSSTLGSAGFPNSSGDPYPEVKMNTYHYSTGTDATNTNYIGTIMSHELGHCIGFRHTDYMNRAYSCGIGGNEGQVKNGVGAVHIAGTPTKADARSWMLACIGSGVNRPFNSNDIIALNYLWP